MSELTLSPKHLINRRSNNSRPKPLLDLAAWQRLLKGRLPPQVVIQLTDYCNASCAQCGMRRENRFTRSTLRVDDIKRLLDAMAERKVAAVSFTGGEPLLYFEQVAECIRYARTVGIRYIRTGTNGFMFRNHHRPDFATRINEMAHALAESGLYTFWISIDSASAQIHEQNRGLPGMLAGTAKALPIFHKHGLFPAANLGINRYLGGDESVPSNSASNSAYYDYFRQAFKNFYTFVEELGFTTVNACYPMNMDDSSDAAVFTATSVDAFIRFTTQEKLQLFQAMFDTIPEFRHRLRIFTPRTALKTLIRAYQGKANEGYACRGGIDFFFIDAKGMNTYPCGFRGEENLGKFWNLQLDSIDKQAWCKQCDWECFRDPSELLGPLLELTTQPTKLIRRFLNDRAYARLWLEDLRYYRACNYFNATLAPDFKKLSAFNSTA